MKLQIFDLCDAAIFSWQLGTLLANDCSVSEVSTSRNVGVLIKDRPMNHIAKVRPCEMMATKPLSTFHQLCCECFSVWRSLAQHVVYRDQREKG